MSISVYNYIKNKILNKYRCATMSQLNAIYKINTDDTLTAFMCFDNILPNNLLNLFGDIYDNGDNNILKCGVMTPLKAFTIIDNFLFNNNSFIRYIALYTLYKALRNDIHKIFSNTDLNEYENFKNFMSYYKNKSDKIVIDKDLTIIGTGGIGFNFLDILSTLKYYGFLELNCKINVYENDILDYTNIPRLPIKFLNHGDQHKLDYLKICVIPIENHINYFYKRWDVSDYDNNSIVIGAPDIETRRRIIENNINHIFITYMDSTMYLQKIDKTSSNLVRETYGRTNITNMILKLFWVVSNFDYILKYFENNNDTISIQNEVAFYTIHKKYNLKFIFTSQIDTH